MDTPTVDVPLSRRDLTALVRVLGYKLKTSEARWARLDGKRRLEQIEPYGKNRDNHRYHIEQMQSLLTRLQAAEQRALQQDPV